MKKVLKIIIITLIVVLNMNVNAEAAWPKTITNQGFTISVEGIDIRCYRLDKSQPKKTLTITNEDGTTSSITTTEDGENYLYENPTKIISLDPNEFTINPEIKEDKLDKINTSFIDLNLNLTKEKLVNLLSAELTDVSEDISYQIEIMVKYKITDYPEKYKYNYKTSLIREFMNMFLGSTANDSRMLDLTKTNYQMINMSAATYNTNTNKVEYLYEDKLGENEELDISQAVLNFQVFSESKEEEEAGNGYVIMFHNVDNIEYLINNINQIEEKPIKNDVNPLTSVQVKVPNTASYAPNMTFVIGGVCIMFGIALLFIATYINQKKSYQK